MLEALIKCGAFDSTGDRRSQMMAVLEDALDHGARIQKEKADAQLDLFADSGVGISRITSYNVCYTKLLRVIQKHQSRLHHT